LTLFLSEQDVLSLLRMKDVVRTVEECFKRQSAGEAVNSPRTRSASPTSVLDVMHASLSYLGRSGVKCYMVTKKGTRFVFLLFRIDDGEPLAVMGADILGRYRTGADSEVATKHSHRKREFRFAVCGAGRQAPTQVLAMAEVAALTSVRVWSPHRERRDLLARGLRRQGFEASAHARVGDALRETEVASAITSSKDPFLTARDTKELEHLNLCGSNSPSRSEASPDCVGSFQTVVVDDSVQSRYESGDLIIAERKGLFSWEDALELKDVVAGRVRPSGRTLFKSNGVAIEDVAAASLVYDRASKSGEFSRQEFRF
jgi:ornithine cyclodeaminase/alanine dehydrogenase-like protein (mu-crystallin family)